MDKDSRRHVGLFLDGKNYDSWKFGIKLALQSDDLLGVVNGTERKPELVRTDIVYICMLSTCHPTSPHVVSVCELSKKEPGFNLHGSCTPNAFPH
jgi:hypothetical protein